MFLSDNGGCAEIMRPETGSHLENIDVARTKTRRGEDVRFGNRPDVMPGPENTYQSYGVAWANLSNTPFKLYKHWVHEGGIATPFIVHWPNGIQEKGGIRHNGISFYRRSENIRQGPNSSGTVAALQHFSVSRCDFVVCSVHVQSFLHR